MYSMSPTVGHIEPSGFVSIGNVTTMKLLLMRVTGRIELLFHVSNKIIKKHSFIKSTGTSTSKSNSFIPWQCSKRQTAVFKFLETHKKSTAFTT